VKSMSTGMKSTSSKVLAAGCRKSSRTKTTPVASKVVAQALTASAAPNVPKATAPRERKTAVVEPITRQSSAVKDTELDLVTDDLYKNLQEDVVMELLSGLRDELTPMYNEAAAEVPAPKQPTAPPDMLWHVVATPQMMRAFSATVALGTVAATVAA